MADYDEKEDLMDRLMAIGKRKKFLSLDELHREMPENMMSPEDIEDVLERLEGANISVAENDAQMLERAQNLALDDEEESVDEDDLDLTSSAHIDQIERPGGCTFWKASSRFLPAKARSRRKAYRTRSDQHAKALSLPPIAVERLLELGTELENAFSTARDGHFCRTAGEIFGRGRGARNISAGHSEARTDQKTYAAAVKCRRRPLLRSRRLKRARQSRGSFSVFVGRPHWPLEVAAEIKALNRPNTLTRY